MTVWRGVFGWGGGTRRAVSERVARPRGGTGRYGRDKRGPPVWRRAISLRNSSAGSVRGVSAQSLRVPDRCPASTCQIRASASFRPLRAASDSAIIHIVSRRTGPRGGADVFAFSRGEGKDDMKNLTFALACASTFALFAAIDVPKADFENYTEETGWTVANKDEPGRQYMYWLYEGASGSDDGSTVKAYGGENLAAPAGSGQNLKYLELSTEGGTLWRSLAAGNPAGTDIAGKLGAAQALPAGGLYIDTMVQFTPTEDGGEPNTVDGDKLAIWLNVDSSGAAPVTNLMVKAAQWDDNGSSTFFKPKTFVLTGAGDISPSTWYRLTVKAIANCDRRTKNENYTSSITGFQIYLDNTLLTTTEPAFADGYLNLATDAGEWGWLDSSVEQEAEVLALMRGRTLIPSLAGDETTATLQAVGFKGSGALDNLAITEQDPLPAPGETIDFTITAGANTTVAWSTDGKTWTDYVVGAQAPAGLLYIRLTNADGATKILTKMLGSGSNSFDFSNETFGWAAYLGEAIDGAYVIDDAAELVMFQKGYVAKLATKDQTFKLGASIALTEPWPGIGVYDNTVNADAFEGTFDGAGFTVSGVTFASSETGNNYRGFFNQINNATVKNLKIEGNGFGAAVPAGEYGCALIVGCANNSTIENCVASGTIASGTHNVGGIAVRIKGTTLRNCTNEANITGSYTKVGGIAVLSQDKGTTSLIENCVNKGTLTVAGNAEKAGRDGLAGIIAYAAAKAAEQLTLKNCSNTGALVKGEGAHPSARVGQIVGWAYSAFTVAGTFTVRDDIRSVGSNDHAADGLNFATVADGVATLVSDGAAVNGAALKVMAAGQTVTLGAIGESITLDTTLATVTVTTTAENAEVKQEGNVYTVVAKSAAEDWPENPSTMAGQTAGAAYGLEGELADAEADKLAIWAKANGVSYAGAAEAIKVEAYLLNVANTDAAIAEGKANFKIPAITVDANGTVTVTPPSGYNGVITIKGSVTVNGTYNLDKADTTARFFKAFLSVK